MYLNSVLESSMRTDDSDVIYDALKDFVAIKREPHRRLVNKLNNILHIPDRIYVILKTNFGYSGQMTRRTRQFEKPTFRDVDKNFVMREKVNKGKRYRPKKAS